MGHRVSRFAESTLVTVGPHDHRRTPRPLRSSRTHRGEMPARGSGRDCDRPRCGDRHGTSRAAAPPTSRSRPPHKGRSSSTHRPIPTPRGSIDRPSCRVGWSSWPVLRWLLPFDRIIAANRKHRIQDTARPETIPTDRHALRSGKVHSESGKLEGRLRLLIGLTRGDRCATIDSCMSP